MRQLLYMACLTFSVVAFTGCGDKDIGPVTVTPEMEAEQKAAEKDVQDAEAAHRKNQKPEKSPDQLVEEAESGRSRPTR